MITVRGNHYQMGFQHARQVRALLPAIREAIDVHFNKLAQDNPDDAFEALVKETQTVLDSVDPAIVDVIRGLADGLELEFERLLRYNLVVFLRDILTTRQSIGANKASPDEGCSTWAATRSATADGQPILVKNRDFYAEHLPLQIVVQAEPEEGFRYTYITSAGSPGVFVAGFNETGLSLVDTHVSSTDVGPGLPTYALSMHILEEYDTVRSALEYLKSIPRLGRNNLLLADATGDVALFEIGYQQFAVLEAENDLLVNTNHFISDKMLTSFVDTQIGTDKGNSQKRYAILRERLTQAHGRIDLSFAQALMASHADPLASICRHPTIGNTDSTISTAIFLIAQRRMCFCHGLPCRGEYTIYEYANDS
jgi:isopenicillin-N N-acyltransferase like protein